MQVIEKGQCHREEESKTSSSSGVEGLTTEDNYANKKKENKN